MGSACSEANAKREEMRGGRSIVRKKMDGSQSHNLQSANLKSHNL